MPHDSPDYLYVLASRTIYLRYAYSVHIASGKDLAVVWQVDVTSILHTLLVPQIESNLVLGIELPSSLLLG